MISWWDMRKQSVWEIVSLAWYQFAIGNDISHSIEITLFCVTCHLLTSLGNITTTSRGDVVTKYSYRTEWNRHSYNAMQRIHSIPNIHYDVVMSRRFGFEGEDLIVSWIGKTASQQKCIPWLHHTYTSFVFFDYETFCIRWVCYISSVNDVLDIVLLWVFHLSSHVIYYFYLHASCTIPNHCNSEKR